MPSASPTVAQRRESVVTRWVDAFNALDLDGMLACLAERVEFRPLRLSGLSGCYRGHDGVREWFASLRHSRQHHPIVIQKTLDVGSGRILAMGCFLVDGEPAIASFCAMNRIEAGVIATAHHYFSDVQVIERLGLIP
jgi:ketosteroid isomerase-like protein